MASRSVNISDYAQALADGTFPGAFNNDRTVYTFPPVVSTSARGTGLVWVVRVRLLSAEGEPLPFDEELLAPGAAAPAGAFGEITTEPRQISAVGNVGKARAGGKATLVRSGKNLGKANATNAATQALRDAFGRYNAQLKKSGASATAADAASATAADAASATAADAASATAADAASAARPAPMLVKKLGETRDATLTPRDFEKGVTVQRKYNGVRAPSYLESPGLVRLYSRTKSDYPGFCHIRRELVGALTDPPPVPDELLIAAACSKEPPGAAELARLRTLYAGARVHLDGEIYKHGKSLRWISGQARRADDEESLDYLVYDCFFPGPKAAGHDLPSASRQGYLDLFFGRASGLVHVQRAENFRATTLAEAEALRDRFLAEGYEGAIARKDCAGYRYGVNNYHSSNLVKLKPIYDSEFEVVAYTQGTKGKDVGAVIWVCEVDPEHAKDPSDLTFHVVPKDMSYEERYTIHRCLGEIVADDRPGAAPGAKTTRFERDFRGRPLTVEYPERSTKTGKPTQAKALVFRTYEDGPALDPVRRLYAECEASRL